MNGYDEEDIVISGIGGHFPECDSLDELSHNLLNGIDMVTEGRPRWEPGELDVPTRTGKMKSLEKCDAQYFGLIGKQCHALDPITRKVLERTYEAIFDAGLNPSELSGSKTGVFFGTSILETEMSLMEMKSSDAYNILGRNKTMNANRVSYWLNLNGPSFTLDSTWSSGLQALALGFQYIRSGVCEAALVGAGSSIIHPEFSKHFIELNMLSPDGISRSFDENANGYVRSEAVVVFVLQRLKNAKRVYGTVVNAVGKAMNTCTGHILIPRQEEWFTLYNEFYNQCKVDPKQVAYLEADGLACQEADTAELNAVNDFFCRERDSSKPLLIGSIKTNLGHTLSAAGLCGLAKVLIANQTGVIPPNLHFTRPNKHVAGLMTGKMKVVTEPTSLEGELIAVNDFGFGGTYSHCLIKRPPLSLRRPPSHTSDDIPRLVLLSARNEEGIEATLNKVENLPHSEECIKLVQDVFSKNIAHHMFRGYTILPMEKGGQRASELFQGDKRPVWFVFSGMGSHWATMGKDLMRLPVFKESIDHCHNILLKKGLNLWNILTQDDSTMFDNILNSFVSISSMQIALVDILYSVGIKPDGIIGHSAGELGAAYADGCLTREEMILSSYCRGKVSNEVKVIKGMMAAIGMGYADIKDSLPEDVEVACHNSSTNCTISGPSDTIHEFVDKLKEKGIFVKAVNVSNIAFHSKHIQEMGPRLREELSKVILNPKKRSPKWISSSVLKERWDDPRWQVCSADYLTNNLLSPVYFEEACKSIPKNAIVIELAPHSLLLPILKRSLSKDCINVGLTHRSAADQLIHVLQAIGKLYTVGLQPKVSALYPEVKLPVSVGTPFLGGLVTWDHSFSWNSKILSTTGASKNSKDITLCLDDGPHYRSFKLDNTLTLPYSTLLGLVLQIFSSEKKIVTSKRGVILEDIFFRKPVHIKKARNIDLSITNCLGTGKFEVMAGEEVIVTGTVKEYFAKNEGALKYMSHVRNPQITMDQNEVYLELLHSGYEYNEPLKTIKTVLNDGNSWESHLQWQGDLTILLESLIQCQVLASNINEHLPEVTLIREIVVEPHLLPESSTELRVMLDKKTGVLSTTGMIMKGLKFKMSERASLMLSDNLLPKIDGVPQMNGHLRGAFVEYFARNVKSRQLGYSGTDSSGLKIMGIGSSNESSLSIEPDEALFWEVPDKWNLEDAATIPLPYSLAYYMLNVVTEMREYDSVLVTNGLSNIGLACIRVALTNTKTVYATVSAEKDKEELSKHFKQLADKILVLESEQEDNLILDITLKTNKFTYVINTYPGKKLEKYLRCLSKFSQIFQVFLEETEQGLEIYGTDALVQQASIFGITLGSVLQCSPCDKAKLKQLLAHGIKSGVVVPLPKSIIPQWQLFERPESLGNETELAHLGDNETSHRFICKSRSSYLIICGQMHMALQTVEWFVKRNAEKITVIHSDNNVSSNIKSKINLIQQKVSLTVKQVELLDEQTLKLSLRDVTNVDAAVLLPIDEHHSKDYSLAVLNFVSTFLGPNGHLICLLRSSSRGVDFCEERSRNGMPTLALLWDGQVNGQLRQIIQVFDRISVRNSQTVLQFKEQDKENNELIYIDVLLNSMPRNAQEVADYAETIPDEVNVKEIKTLSLPSEYTKETLPIFLLQGIKKDKNLTEKFRRSLYPVFVVEIPHLGNSSIEEMASYVVPKMKSVCRGPFVIIGEQWGGCVALELARQLEHLGHKTQVFLVSGTPAEVVGPLKYVADDAEPLEVSLLSRLLHIKDIKVLQEISNQKDWRSKVEYCSQLIKHDDENKVAKGLDAIKCRLEALLAYSMKEPLNGPLTVITNREIPFEYYNQLSKIRVAVHEIRDREDALTEDIFRMIHDTVIHKTINI